ncbi:hypothetical protein [Nocardioides rubriscoriae]|uniref:hypothetical protein n=1 Tax=Nocardioides rubriscoriae TaxID=642762 RepID=UPI0011DF65D0|nr:hypothetical protein [Nocardioides rubriscoriae]
MGFSLDLAAFVDTEPTGPQGLDLAEDAINNVIDQIDTELKTLRPVDFESEGAIRPTSFGGADAAPELALHHSRAHEVTYKTLIGLKDDLVAFQEACRKAKQEVVLADQDAAERQRRTLQAVELLEVGASQQQSRRDHEQAQQDQDVTGGSDA